MRTILVFFLYIAAAHLLAAVALVPLGAVLTEAGADPHKIIGRGGLLLAVGGAFYFFRFQGLATKADLGYGVAAPVFRRSLVKGFAAGVLILLCLSAALWLVELRFFPPGGTGRPLADVFTQGLLGGLAVGFIEETFFRGALYAGIRRNGGGPAAAAIGSSLLFAAMHFIKPQPFPAGVEVSLAQNLASLGGALPNLFRLEHLDSFAALFMVGVFLSLVRHKTGHVGWCIGLHAGWVLVIKLTLAYTMLDADSPYAFLVGNYDDLIGWLAAAWLALLALGLHAARRFKTAA